MSNPRLPNKPTLRHRNLVAIDGALALIAVLLVVQMWLFTASLEEYLAGHHDVALPAAVISGVLFAGCSALYFFVRRLEIRSRRQDTLKE